MGTSFERQMIGAVSPATELQNHLPWETFPAQIGVMGPSLSRVRAVLRMRLWFTAIELTHVTIPN